MRLEVDLTKRIDHFQLNATFTVTEKRIGIFGPSGSGKSTLINLLTGLIDGDSGHIKLNDQWLYHHQLKQNVSTNNRHIAVVFQHSHLFPHFSAEKNLLYGYRRLKKGQRKLKPDAVIEALELGSLLKQRIHGLSGGERQRIALGRALLASPELLILDEPLSALDHHLKGQIIHFLRRSLNRFDIPYIYISHSLNEMRRLTDQVIVLQGGTVNEVTTAEKLALKRITNSHRGYINHLTLVNPREVGDLFAYRWGDGELMLSNHAASQQGLFELSSKEILLFKKHPGALSARNLFNMKITDMTPMGNSIAVTLSLGGQVLISQVMREAAAELELQSGNQVFVAIKASVFRPLD